MPPKQQSLLCCLALLAMAKLTPNTPCRKASNDWIRILPRLSSSVKPNGSRGSSYPTPPSILLPYSESSRHQRARTRRSRSRRSRSGSRIDIWRHDRVCRNSFGGDCFIENKNITYLVRIFKMLV